MFIYTVQACFDDAAVAEEFIDWLQQGHIQDVIDAGALTGQVIRVDVGAEDDATAIVEARYTFDSRDAFAAYERDDAPRLRQEGLERFGPERGIRFERSTGIATDAHTR